MARRHWILGQTGLRIENRPHPARRKPACIRPRRLCLTPGPGAAILWDMGDVLRLLRLFGLLRLVQLFLVGLLMWGMGGLPTEQSWLLVPILLPIGFVLLPGLTNRLSQRRMLSISLFLFITCQSIELTASNSNQQWIAWLDRAGQEFWPILFAWRSESYFYLLVPVVLTAWAFGWRGTLWATNWAAAIYVVGGVWLWSADGALPLEMTLTVPAKLILLYLVPFAVAHLSATQRRQHDELESAHTRLQRQAALAEQLAASRERNRLARELHDTLAHSLSGLSVQLQAVDVLLDDDPAVAWQSLAIAQRTARSGLDETRRAIAALRASPLENLGLEEALRRRTTALGERAGLDTEWNVEGTLDDLDPVVEQAIYRIADEALLNCERHSAARRVAVRLARNREEVSLWITDDGQGFDPNELPSLSEGHYGLTGMQERAELVGGRLGIESAPLQGTTLHLCIKE